MSDNDDSNEEILASGRNEDTAFDTTIGHIEDIIIDESFEKMQNEFMNKYYHRFEDSEENKLDYMIIFQEYQKLIETYLEKELTDLMPDFSMPDFIKQLVARRKDLDGEVFEMLYSLSDFLAFKELMLDFKNEKDGSHLDLTEGIVVTSLANLQISK